MQMDTGEAGRSGRGSRRGSGSRSYRGSYSGSPSSGSGNYSGRSGQVDQYNQGWTGGRRGQGGRGYWGGSRGANRGGRGGGRASAYSASSARPPLPDDLEFVSSLKGHTKKVTSILLDDASGSLFTGSHDGTVRVWSTASGECASVVEMGGEVDSMLLEAGFLFVGVKAPQGAGTIKVWNVATGVQHALEGHVGQVLSLAAAGGLLFSGGQDRTLRAWAPDPATGLFAPSAVLTEAQGGHSAAISCLRASGDLLFSADFEGTIKAWDITAGVVRQTIVKAHSGKHVSAVTDLLVWSGHLVSAGLDGRVKVWEPADPATGLVLSPQPAYVLPEPDDDGVGGGGGASNHGASPGSRQPVASRLGGRPPRPGSGSGSRSGSDLPDLPGVLALAGVADSEGRAVLMISLNGERCVRLWELPSFADRGTLADVANARALAGHAASGLLFSGDERGHIRVWRWKQPSSCLAPQQLS